MSHFRFHERFRWPVEQVLLVGFGMVALPVPAEGQTLVAGLPLPLPSSPPRADVLVFVESKGKPSGKSKYALKIAQRKREARKLGLSDNAPYPLIYLNR